eukprot:GFYU01007552.1.p1 GENE.GFYU01007552.1~~GFYU01007552.1.p1  ORF type:complete len:351 (+),score=60.12 GFYU01007552.1:44-1096(+)
MGIPRNRKARRPPPGTTKNKDKQNAEDSHTPSDAHETYSEATQEPESTEPPPSAGAFPGAFGDAANATYTSSGTTGASASPGAKAKPATPDKDPDDEAMDGRQFKKPAHATIGLISVWTLYLVYSQVFCAAPDCSTITMFRNWVYFLQTLYNIAFLVGYRYPEVQMFVIQYTMYMMHGLLWANFIALPVLGTAIAPRMIRPGVKWMEKMIQQEADDMVMAMISQIFLFLVVHFMSRKRVCAEFQMCFATWSKSDRRINCVYQVTSPILPMIVWLIFLNPGHVYGIDYFTDLPYVGLRGWFMLLVIFAAANGCLFAYFWKKIKAGAMRVIYFTDPRDKQIKYHFEHVYKSF